MPSHACPVDTFVPDVVHHNAVPVLKAAACVGAAAFVAMKVKGALARRRIAQERAARKKDTVYLFAFPRTSRFVGVSSPSLKVETFLRLCGIPYEMVFTMDPSVSPTERLPYIEYNGEPVAESEFIMERLVELFPEQCAVDASLSEEEKAAKTALRRIVETTLYYGKSRNAIVDNISVMAKAFGELLPLPGWAVEPMMRRTFRANYIKLLNMQGYGDLTHEQYHAEFLGDLKAVESLLARKLLPRDVPSVQAMLYGYLSGLRVDCTLGLDAACPALQHFKASPLLNALLDDIEATAFPDKAELLKQAGSATASYGSVLKQ